MSCRQKPPCTWWSSTKLDGSSRTRDSPAGYQLAAREAGSLTHRLVGTSLQPLDGIVEVKEPPEGSPDAGQQHTWTLQTKEQFELAYLPEVLADARGLPPAAGKRGKTNQLRWRVADRLRYRIRLSGVVGVAPGPVSWDPVHRVVGIELAPAQKLKVLFNSEMPVAAQPYMGVWRWIRDAAPANLPALKVDLDAGRNWLHMPYRQLVLTHAVQQPLAVPAFTALATSKAAVGSTIATFVEDARLGWAEHRQGLDISACLGARSLRQIRRKAPSIHW